MKVYHATTKENWKEIQKEGVLWGRKGWYWDGKSINTKKRGNKMSRLTYLAIEKENARYGKCDGSGEWAIPEVLLEVEFPNGNYSWQIAHHEPIPISQIKRIQ